MRHALIAAVMAVLVVVAMAGWMRQPGSIPAANGFPAYNQLTPVAYNQPYYNPATYTGVPAPYGAAQPVMQAAPRQRRAAVQRQGVAARESYVPVRSQTAVRRGRPLSHSVAIVAGSAGAGAAIGALAGHGKGAAIGALTGGLGGLVYDRLTHDK